MNTLVARTPTQDSPLPEAHAASPGAISPGVRLTSHAAIEIPANDAAAPFAPPVPAGFRPAEILVVLVGASAVGLALGALAALIVGRDAPSAIQALVWMAFGAMFLLESRTLVELSRQRDWAMAAFFAPHLMSYAAWPFAVTLYAPEAGGFWLGLIAIGLTQWAFLASRTRSRLVFRGAGHTLLIAALTALQGTLVAFGA